MSELINNSAQRKELLKHMILQLHGGEAPEAVRQQLLNLLKGIPYDEVVEVEQELINEGLPAEEVLKFCDIHTQVLDGHIDQSGAKPVPAGHPVDTFKKENRELEKVCLKLNLLLSTVPAASEAALPGLITDLTQMFNLLMDVDKHYRRKENLLFPFLEQHGITGPPKVMWGKHDEVREMLKASLEALKTGGVTLSVLEQLSDMVLKPAAKAITDMIMKEEEILFPMTMDELTDAEWYNIYLQTNEIGYCLYDPKEEWNPSDAAISQTLKEATGDGTVRLPSGSFTLDELTVLLNTLPIDVTFVDRNDKVKFFTQGMHRIFDRNRAILGRDVRMCHPPHSVHIVEQIISDFKSGKESSAPFWIQMGPRFIYINYFPLRDAEGNYLGTIEFSQDLTELRALEGEQRLLSYGK
ncbi:MAG TPA: DUF438 domain-containing protein [Bacteroidales bacterium]|jgi:DUF438 domain-containing protein|nr:DUF438 domain-containing protein [Bacteroidales bacterium]